MDLNTSGIYAIRNMINEKVYIGSSTNMYRRRSKHFSYLRNNRHCNNHLQNAWNKYGENNFGFEVLEYVPEENLVEREKTWITNYSNEVYNLTEVVEKEFRLSEETKRKIGKANKGKVPSEEAKQKMSKAHKGLRPSEETIQKMSKAQKGKIVSEETRKKISKIHKGKTLSEETRQKISKANKGKKLSKAHKDKISQKTKGKNNPHYGHRHTEESKKKIAETARRRYAKDGHPWLGRKHSEESKLKISQTLKDNTNRIAQRNKLQLTLW